MNKFVNFFILCTANFVCHPFDCTFLSHLAVVSFDRNIGNHENCLLCQFHWVSKLMYSRGCATQRTSNSLIRPVKKALAKLVFITGTLPKQQIVRKERNNQNILKECISPKSRAVKPITSPRRKKFCHE